ncbi:hypothetical protein [Streptomyces pactum]|uniref:hypothetical protein n=1 Tax=Streptomyces pactum TaxID=68249 RepID=UPI0036FAFC4C
MNGTTLVLRALHHGERRLARQLTAVAEHHRAEHEVHHVATDLARWSREHADRLAEAGHDRGHPAEAPEEHPPSPLTALREGAAHALGDRPDPGLLLLWDLRKLHLSASGNSLYWEMLAQAAQAAHDGELLQLASRCHPQTLRQMKWTNTMMKVLSPQVLTTP